MSGAGLSPRDRYCGIVATNNAKLEKLFSGQVTQMSGDLVGLAAQIRAGSAPHDVADRIYTIAHSLHGAGSMYGFSCVSDMGAAIEKLTAALRCGRLAPDAKVADLIESCAAALHDIAEFHGAAGPSSLDRAIIAEVAHLVWECECALHDGTARADSEPAPSPASS